MRRVKNEERKNEIERDKAFRFVAEQYVSNGYYLHFHRNLEIYGVVKGNVAVTIPFLDMLQVGGMTPKVPVQQELYMQDGLHPNDEGHAKIAARLKGFLESL